ncbi:SDR family oxidoreductase [Thalassomonas viridans]|uniref:SDR family oxidoreductase n=1 Tax=Thalassomonas viridans TaxID=137584 RepID=A0AAF0CDD2_9GAMM|nr:SDR family oxidoreductase [Thalassomonas viridans]WDE08009.1 SDR family oxidoreductase [Thalassomonas viridans]
MNILVVGNTGPVGLGRAVCKILSQGGPEVKIKALVREQTRQDQDRKAVIDELLGYGAELVSGDLKDPLSLKQACEGMDVVITTATTTSVRQPGDTIASVDLNGQMNLLNAAREAGVKHYVYTSYSKNTQDFGPCELTSAKQTLEKQVMASGMTYTILRPGYFTECWLSPRFGFDIKNSTAHFFGDGTREVSYISTEDVAKYAVAALTNPNGKNAVLELGGPDAIAPLDLVKMCEQAGCNSFTVSFNSLEQLEHDKMQAESSLDKSLISLGIALAKGDDIPMEEMAALFPEVRLQKVEDYIKTLV